MVILKAINLAVNRNKEKFPNDFYFQLTKKEYKNLRFQIETKNNMSRTLPYVFTQEGVAMLATVLHTSVASKISVDIMRAFIAMRKFINNDIIELKSIQDMLIQHNNKFDYIDDEIKSLQVSYNNLVEKRKLNQIYFNGEYYNAYSNIIEIFKECKNELIIIDSYADKEIKEALLNKINNII